MLLNQYHYYRIITTQYLLSISIVYTYVLQVFPIDDAVDPVFFISQIKIKWVLVINRKQNYKTTKFYNIARDFSFLIYSTYSIVLLMSIYIIISLYFAFKFNIFFFLYLELIYDEIIFHPLSIHTVRLYCAPILVKNIQIKTVSICAN